ncbi:MAG: type V CRISPR-associated protein Cas12a/Cpf1, partial [Clostridia bacterium]|nr:type V CRISPR-associated protein Cas12a/Cpf1 [Clostridia bacterium]
NISGYDLNGIFVKNSTDLTAVCSGAFGFWGAAENGWNNYYDSVKGYKDTDKYVDARKKAYKAVDSFSLADIQKYAENADPDEKTGSVSEWLKTEIAEKCGLATGNYERVSQLISNPYTGTKKLFNNDDAVELIKDALDSVKELERTMKYVLGTCKEADKDENFYGEFLPLYERICEIDALYDKVRNYMTQKPYKTEKIKLNFQNPQFLGGWDRNKESDYSAVLLRKNGQYFVAVMSSGFKKSFEEIPAVKDGEPAYEKVIYKLLPGPNKMLPKVFFSRKGIATYNPPEDILDKYNRGTHTTGPDFNLTDCRNLIDFFKGAIAEHPDWSRFGFRFSDTSEYRNIADFYNEVKNQGYKITFCDVPVSYINTLVDDGKLYLFQLYNKDFSEHSRGTPNLHTLYFRMLFDERNLENVVFKLNGESEMFYREASIGGDDMIVHPKNQPIKNKNGQNSKKQSTFEYDIIKDRRYTADQFMIHIPITLNFTAGGGDINQDVRKALKESDDNYV